MIYFLTVQETSSTTAQEVATSDALIAVGTGTNASVRLYELGARQKGCVAQCTLPSASGSVEACAFPEDIPIPFSKEIQFIKVPRSCVSSFMDYGIFAGGQQGELASWDIRQTKQPLWQLTRKLIFEKFIDILIINLFEIELRQKKT